MKTITKQVKELQDLNAVLKTFKNDKGEDVAYYEYRLYYNDKDYVVIAPVYNTDKKTLKELVSCGAIKLN